MEGPDHLKRNERVVRLIPYVQGICGKYKRRYKGLDFDDIQSIAYEALVKASYAKPLDWSDASFQAYLDKRIAGAIIDEWRSYGIQGSHRRYKRGSPVIEVQTDYAWNSQDAKYEYLVDKYKITENHVKNIIALLDFLDYLKTLTPGNRFVAIETVKGRTGASIAKELGVSQALISRKVLQNKQAFEAREAGLTISKSRVDLGAERARLISIDRDS